MVSVLLELAGFRLKCVNPTTGPSLRARQSGSAAPIVWTQPMPPIAHQCAGASAAERGASPNAAARLPTTVCRETSRSSVGNPELGLR